MPINSFPVGFIFQGTSFLDLGYERDSSHRTLAQLAQRIQITVRFADLSCAALSLRAEMISVFVKQALNELLAA